MIYHIARKNVIKEIITFGIYSPEGYKGEGFIHCSTQNQVIPVANRFYTFTNDLILMEIDDAQMGKALVFENLEGGTELFPHIYCPIPIGAINRIALLPLNGTGFSFPQIWLSIDEALTW